jgi:hypothetical protein
LPSGIPLKQTNNHIFDKVTKLHSFKTLHG